MRRWIVDASNVFGSRPDGWWRDRDRALRRLVDEIARWRCVAGEPVLVVADGFPSARVPRGTTFGVHVLFSHSRARDAADDEIARIVARHDDPTSVVVVTADRDLRMRVERHGAGVAGPGTFLDTIAAIPERRQERAVLAHFGAGEDALLGGGGEARVFAIGDDRVARITHPGTDPTSLHERRRLLDHVRSARLPFAVPELIEQREIEGRLVVIERRLPGRDALEALADPATDRATLIRSHLDAARAIAAVEAPTSTFGELWGDDAIRTASFVEWAVARLQASRAWAGEGFDHVDPAGLADALVAALPQPAPAAPRLVHLDAFLGNMLAEDDHVTSVLDFGPTSIGGPPDLDVAVAIAYLAPEITPTSIDADRSTARAWAEERALGGLLEPSERWIAAYWTGAPDDGRLRRWCRRILG